tara:strand:+ start:214951 stop:215811 length:861 start_codon:yes stop_codon:yes gene_type:complete
MTITKAIFPVAGLGTRFLPATKASPKEMLPVIDKPIIQYAVEEALSAGIKELIFVTSYSKRAIEDHFDSNFELEYMLEQRGKTELLKAVRDIIPDDVQCVYIRQKHALGLGHAVLCAQHLITDEHFAVILADDLINGGEHSCMQQMVQAYQQHAANYIAVQTVKPEETVQYGIVKTAESHKLSGIVEKPQAKDAPSNLGVVGRYVLHSDIFKLLKRTQPGAGKEIQLTDAIAQLLQTHDTFALPFTGKRFDCGSKLGYLEATLDYGVRHPELHESFKQLVQRYAKA